MRKALEGSRTRKKTRKQTNKPKGAHPKGVARDTPSCGRRVHRGGHTVPSVRPARLDGGPVHAMRATVCHVRGAVWRSASHPGFVRVCAIVDACAAELPKRKCGAPARSLSPRADARVATPTHGRDRLRRSPLFPPGASCALSHASGCTTTGGNALRRLRRKRQRRKPPRRARVDSDTIFSNRFAWY